MGLYFVNQYHCMFQYLPETGCSGDFFPEKNEVTVQTKVGPIILSW